MKLFGVLALVVALGPPVYAQVDLVGEWGQRQHEDQPERGPGPELGDYLGLPINAAARAKALLPDESLVLAAAVTVIRVAPADFVETVLTTGSLVAREEILVGPEVEGLRIT